MAVNAGTIRVILTGDARGLQATLDRAGASLQKAGQRMAATGARLTTGLTLPLLLAGGAAIKMGVDFDREMTKIETLVGVAADQVNDWRKELLQLGPAVGKGPRELARAMFFVTSAGARGAEALSIVEQAAKASAIGLGETADVARAVTAAMQAYGSEVLDAARATDIMVATVRAGALEARELAGSLGRVIGIAAQVGVSFEEVGAFVATFTRLGVSAEESMTALRGILNSVLKPTAGASKALKEAGISVEFLRNSIKSKGLTATLTELVAQFKGNTAALAQVIPNVRALSGVLGTAGAQGEAFNQILSDIQNSVGILDEAFERVKDTPAQSFAELKAQAEAVAIALGDELAPALADVLTAMKPLLSAVGFLAEAFGSLPGPVKTAFVALATIGVVLGPIIFIVGNIITAVGALLPFLTLLVGGIATVAAVIASPVGLVVALLAAGAAFLVFKNRGDEAKRAAKEFADSIEPVGKALASATLGQAQAMQANLNIAKANLVRGRQEIQDELDKMARPLTGGAAGAGAGMFAELADPAIDAFRKLSAEAAAADVKIAAVGEQLGEATKRVRALTPIKIEVEAPDGPPEGLSATADEVDRVKDAVEEMQSALLAAERTAEVMGVGFDLAGERTAIFGAALSTLAPLVDDVDAEIRDTGLSLRDLANRYRLGTAEANAFNEALREQKRLAGQMARLNGEQVQAQIALAKATGTNTTELLRMQLKTRGFKGAELDKALAVAKATEAIKAQTAALERAKEVELEEINARFQAIQRAASDMASEVTAAFERMLQGEQNALDSFISFLKNILTTLGETLTSQFLLLPLTDLLTKGLGDIIPGRKAPRTNTATSQIAPGLGSSEETNDILSDIAEGQAVGTEQIAGAVTAVAGAVGGTTAEVVAGAAASVATMVSGQVTEASQLGIIIGLLTAANAQLAIIAAASTAAAAGSFLDAIPFAAIFSGGGGGGDGGGGGGLPTGTSAGFGGGFFQHGGRVAKGATTIVGERGPEVFVPGTSGSVVPTNRLGTFGGAGEGPVVMQEIHFHIDMIDAASGDSFLRNHAGTLARINQEATRQSFQYFMGTNR